MITERINALGIEHRGLFTAIYGVNRTDEIYITSDTKVYNLYEALYLYLLEQGYITVFYDDKAFSYDENQLMQFFEFAPQDARTNANINNSAPSGGRRDFFKNKGPMSKSRERSFETTQRQAVNNQTHHDAIQLIDNSLVRHYAVLQEEGFFATINGIVEQDAPRKVAVVFTNPSTLIFDEGQQRRYENYLNLIRTNYISKQIGLKLIGLYDFESHEAFAQDLKEGTDKFLFRPPFKDLILNDLTSTADDKERHQHNTVFFLGDPGKDEVENLLQLKRLEPDMPNFLENWEDIVLNIWQGISANKKDKNSPTLRLMKDFLWLTSEDFNSIIKGISTEKAIDRLKHMEGIDIVYRQFEQYRQSLRAHRNGNGGGRFRPHMALMGSPGTGKTTVARLFGEILREDHLLPKGHFVKVDVSELIGEYVGSTRPKTRAVCERARGGVLFIDEAYGLMSGENDHGDVNYGKEAIEVLIQFMEDHDDSLVILAGYTDEIMHLINEGNQGFRRRFNELGFFHFEDYKPDVLFNIAMKMIPVETTDAFRTALRNIITYKYAYRTKKFGNVGEMENLVNNIVGTYRESLNDQQTHVPLDVVHLPERLKLLVDPAMLNPDMMLAELNSLVGQNGIKQVVRNLFNKCRSERIKLALFPVNDGAAENEGFRPEMSRLNFIFSGNPGTGKTTIARIMGTLLQRLGVLSSTDASVLTEVAGNDLLTATPATIKKLFEDNIGKVLFIDEAYQLRESPRIVADIVGNITNKDYQNKLCIILAGYTDDMEHMMDVNFGMRRRFDVVPFVDYTDEELWEILERMVGNPKNQVRMDLQACKPAAMSYFKSLVRDRNFGNAGVVDNLMAVLKSNRDVRYSNASVEQQRNLDFALRILPVDFPVTQQTSQSVDNKIQQRQPLPSPIGFDGIVDCSNEDSDTLVHGGGDLYASVGLLRENTSGGEGTAFIISVQNRFILTASHVVEGGRSFSFTLNMSNGSNTVPAQLLWTNPLHDMAILRTASLPDNAKRLSFDVVTPRDPGLNIQIAAFPLGGKLSGNRMILTQGAIGNYEKQCTLRNENGITRIFDAIRTEAQATFGSSGGPVMMTDGFKVIGVLHGGVKENGFNINAVTDIAQLFDDNTLNINI